ncbi:MAG TPA: ABC transporter permease [Pyrinomonadaceae bacterium]|jgi:lipopolysaccharide transport system permease protein|nr:ABC transporter permease [Pyrinomonadaceae bacterium]
MSIDSRNAASATAVEVVHTPDSELRHPKRLIIGMCRDLWASRELAWLLMVRDISARYRQSFLGFAWALLPPVVMALGFTLAGKAQVINVAATQLPYPAYVIFSMVLWLTFVDALNGPVQAVANAKVMLSRINFPREAIVLAKLGEVFFNFAIKLVLILAVFFWYHMPVTKAALLAPLSLLSLILLGTFFGLLLAPLGVLYQDITHGLTVFTGLWLFLTPVVYPVPSTGTFAAIVRANPVTPLLATTRELATTGVVSDPYRFLAVTMAAIAGLLVTWIAFRLAMPFAIERVSS